MMGTHRFSRNLVAMKTDIGMSPVGMERDIVKPKWGWKQILWDTHEDVKETWK